MRMNDRLELYRSDDAGKSLDERLKQRTPSKNLSLLFFEREHSIPTESDLDGEITTSLREWASHQPTEALRKILEYEEVENIPEGPKDAVLDLYYDTCLPKTLYDCFVDVLSFGSQRVQYLRELVELGGHREVAKDAVYGGTCAAIANYPSILLFDDDTCFVEQVPDEVLEILKTVTDEQWDYYKRVADRCADLMHFVRCATDLYGIVAVPEVLDLWEEKAGKEEDGLVLMAFVRATIKDDNGAGFRVIRDEDKDITYVVADAFYEAMGGDINEPYLEAMLSGQEYMDEPCPMRQELLDDYSVAVHVMRTPEATRLIKLLDENVPETQNDWFSLDVTASFIFYMRDLDSTEIIDQVFDEFDVTAAGVLARQIRIACEDVNRVVPKWHLRGWTRAELGEPTGMGESALEMGEQPWCWGIESGFYYNIDDEDEAEDDGHESDDRDDDLLISLEVNQSNDYEAHYQYQADREAEGEEAADDLYSDIDYTTLIEENEGYLGQFEKDLTESGLKEKTIENHLLNTRFFLNNFVAGYEGLPMRYGVYLMQPFLGAFFIRKAMWSKPATIKQTATSLKKFYRCMVKLGHVDKEEYDYLVDDIKEYLDEWCDLCERYNNPFTSPFGFGLFY